VRFTFMALVLVYIGSASIAKAGGLEYGPRVATSIPTHDVREALGPGLRYGWTATFMDSPSRGSGFDISYCRWPGSSEIDRRLDQLFSALSGVPISGSKTTVSTVQVAVHRKLFALDKGPILPWLKFGAGVERVNSKLELPIGDLQDAGFRVTTSGPGDVSYRFGLQIGPGLDVRITANTKLGLDASYGVIFTEEPLITAFSISAFLLDAPRQAATGRR